MKTKIFERLKQAYAPLGLGDEFLQAQADALASTGLVTDETLESVVNSQKAFLESIQKSNDKRVTEATKKAEAKAAEAEKSAKAEHDALLKQLDELNKQLNDVKAPKAETAQKPKDEDDFQKKFEAANAGTLAQMKQMQELLEKMQNESRANSEKVMRLEEEKAALERQQAATKRHEAIIEKAKELQIPQYRIDEGFSIADDADDVAIGAYLTNVAGNIKKNTLPSNSHFAMQGKEVSKADTDELAAKMV